VFRCIACTAFLLFSSCAPSSKEVSKRPLRLNLSQDPATLDPRRAADFSSASLTFLLYDGLTRSTSDKCFAPALAESIEVSADRLTYTFKLKKAFWSNHEPLTAYDFERSWKEVLSPNFPCTNAHLFYPIAGAKEAKQGEKPIDEIGVKALDERTFEVRLHQPTPYFLELTAFCAFFPYKEDPTHGRLFSGPYSLKEFRSKDHIHLTKNTFYWNQEKVQLERIHFSLVEQANTVLDMFEKGELDILISSFTPIPPEAVPHLQKTHVMQSVETAGSTILSFNMASGIFKNEKMRQAFILSIDRKEIVENLASMNEEIATSFLPNLLMGDENKTLNWKVDRERAYQLFLEALEELNLSTEELHIRFILSANHSSNFYQAAQVIQEQIRQSLGITIQLDQLETKIYFDHLYKHDYDMAGCFIIAQYMDPLAYLDRFVLKTHLRNYPAFEDLTYQSLIQSSFFANSVEERTDLLRKAEKILINSGAILPIYHFRNSFFVSKKIKNLKTFPQGTLYLDEIEVENE